MPAGGEPTTSSITSAAAGNDALFRGRESHIGDARLSANVQDADNVPIGARFVPTYYYRLFGIQLHKTFEQLSQLLRIQGSSIHNNIAVRFHIHNDVPNRRRLFLSRCCLRNFDIEFVFTSSRVKREQEEDQQEKQNVDQRRELNTGVNWDGAATKIHSTEKERGTPGVRIRSQARPELSPVAHRGELTIERGCG